MRLSSSSNPSDDRDPGAGAGRDDLRIFLLAAAGVLVFMIVFLYFCKPYDLATGMFFAFALGLLARGRLLFYLGVFALASLNRETTFLLIMVFAIFFFFRLPWRRYLLWVFLQALLLVLVRLTITTLYASNPGASMRFEPLSNFQHFLQDPLLSLSDLVMLALVLWMCARRWKEAPQLLRVALVVMLPLQLVLYLVLGNSFEIRVFAEVYPVVWAMLWKL